MVRVRALSVTPVKDKKNVVVCGVMKECGTRIWKDGGVFEEINSTKRVLEEIGWN